MKHLTAIILAILLSSCLNPRVAGFREQNEICGLTAIIQNAGCRSCFQISYEGGIPNADWIGGVPGCTLNSRISKWTYRFRIDETFDEHIAIEEIWQRAEAEFCDK